jgi:hypothetical protein
MCIVYKQLTTNGNGVVIVVDPEINGFTFTTFLIVISLEQGKD